MSQFVYKASHHAAFQLQAVQMEVPGQEQYVWHPGMMSSTPQTFDARASKHIINDEATRHILGCSGVCIRCMECEPAASWNRRCTCIHAQRRVQVLLGQKHVSLNSQWVGALRSTLMLCCGAMAVDAVAGCTAYTQNRTYTPHSTSRHKRLWRFKTHNTH